MSANDEWFKKKYESSYNFNKDVETVTGKGEIPPNVSPFEKANNNRSSQSGSSYSGTNFGYGYGSSNRSNSGYSSQKRC